MAESATTARTATEQRKRPTYCAAHRGEGLASATTFSGRSSRRGSTPSLNVILQRSHFHARRTKVGEAESTTADGCGLGADWYTKVTTSWVWRRAARHVLMS